MDTLKHSLHTAGSHKTQEKKVVQITEAALGDKATAGGDITVTSAFQPAAFVDGNIHYQFRMENTAGEVTYQVIQVSDGRGKGGALNVVSSANLTGAQQAVTQTVIQNPLRNGGPAGERTGDEGRCGYFAETSVSEGSATARSMQAAGDPSLTQTTVERRRRDKINNWIVTLSKIIPDCSLDCTKTSASKGGILSKACDFITDLKEHNQRLQEILRGLERERIDQDLLRQQLEELKSENVLLREQLEQHGIEAMTDTPAQ